MRVPSVTGLPGVRSRWDDLTALHQTQTDYIHLTAYFLPFHRLMIHAHEVALRQFCHYKGDIPYWDEARDAGHFSRSQIFDPLHGFGGESNRKSKCVENGPFRNMSKLFLSLFSFLLCLLFDS